MEDHKTFKKFIEHYLNVHGGRVAPHENPHPDHDHPHFKCCGQYFCGEERFREHVAVAHAGVDVDEIRELAPELVGLEPQREDGDGPADDGDDGADGAADDEGDSGGDGGDGGDGSGDDAAPSQSKGTPIDESKLEGLSGKERAIKKAKLIAEKKRQG